MAHYKREELLYRTLWAYRDQHTPEELKNIEFVIVDDDGGKSELFRKVLKVHSKALNITAASMDEGTNNASGPMNYAIKLSKGELVVLTNPENIPYTPHLLTKIKRLMMMGGLVRHLACACYGLSDGHTDELRDVDWSSPQQFVNCLSETEFNSISSNGSIKGLEGWRQHTRYRPADWYFLSAIFRKPLYTIRGFDEDYMEGQGKEDVDFANRVIKLGMEMVRTDEIVCLHQNHYNADSHQFASNRKDAVRQNTKVFKTKRADRIACNIGRKWGNPKSGNVLRRSEL